MLVVWTTAGARLKASTAPAAMIARPAQTIPAVLPMDYPSRDGRSICAVFRRLLGRKQPLTYRSLAKPRLARYILPTQPGTALCRKGSPRARGGGADEEDPVVRSRAHRVRTVCDAHGSSR